MYNLFISHAWHRSEHYKKVIEWIRDSDISYKNYSVPEENPLHSGNKFKLQEDLTAQIRPASCVIILSGMYAAHSGWIEYEINEAVRMGKYIIGVPTVDNGFRIKLQQLGALRSYVFDPQPRTVG